MIAYVISATDGRVLMRKSRTQNDAFTACSPTMMRRPGHSTAQRTSRRTRPAPRTKATPASSPVLVSTREEQEPEQHG